MLPRHKKPQTISATAHTRHGCLLVEYTVEQVREGGRLVGFRLDRGGGITYHLDCWLENYWPCSCSDYDLREGEECRHAAMLRELYGAEQCDRRRRRQKITR
jgi:hypothetical protein